jgi:hypothetical protein
VRLFITILAYALSLVVVAAVAFVVVIVFAGPHSGLLPGWLEAVLLGLGWLAVLILPALAAFAVWRRMGRRQQPPRQAG